MIVRILRNGIFQSYPFNGKGRQTVAEILDHLNYDDDLMDIDGNHAERITWECSCMQKVCGACAMIINGKPALACASFIDTDKEKTLELRPLSKFPLIKDLKVDRSIIDESLRAFGIYSGTVLPADKKHEELRYNVAKCLKCGICLEICPNYKPGSKEFVGAVLANDACLQYTVSENRKAEISKAYKEHFEQGCSKALSCRDACPLKMPTLSSISFMNRT